MIMTAGKQSILNAELASGEEDRIKAALSALNEMLRAMEADASSLQPLSILLDNDDLEIRRSASWCIAKLAQNKAIQSAPLDKIISLLADSDEEIRENATWSLGELAGVKVGVIESIEPLNRSLEDGNVQVRGMAAWALGRLAEKMGLAQQSSISILERLLMDKSQFVSKGASYSLERVTKITARNRSGLDESES